MKIINKIADLVTATKIPPHLFVAATSWLSRLLSAALQIISIRYMIQILGIDNYATFTLIAALAAWAALTDMGIGSSLQNYITEHKAQNKAYNDWIASAGVCSFILFGVFSILNWPIAWVLSTHYLKNSTLTDNILTIYLSLTLFNLTYIGGISYKIWFAEHKGWIANIAQTTASAVGLILIIALEKFTKYPSLMASVFAYYFPSAITPSIILAKKTWHTTKNIKNSIIKRNSINIFKRASGFWLFTAAGTLTLQVDYIVMSQKLSSNDIIAYSILTKIFSFILILYAAILQATWPSFVELRINKQFQSIRSTIRKYILIGILFSTIGVVVFIFLKKSILHTLAPQHIIYANNSTILLFGIYLATRIYSDTLAIALQSLNKTSPLWLITPAQALISFLLQWNLANTHGINGILIGLSLSFILIAIPWLTYFSIKELNQPSPSKQLLG